MTDKNRMIVHLIIAMIVLPGTVVLLIPGILIWMFGIDPPGVGEARLWLAKPLLPGGLVVIGWTVASLVVHGKGTPAPWAPTKHLVVSGAYKYVRNPMIIGVLMMLTGEALLFNSDPIGLWAATFFVLNTLYFMVFEEPTLEKRFGDEYRLYKANVGRWIPRLSAWTPPWASSEPEAEDPQAVHWQGYKGDESSDKNGPQ